MMVEADIRVNDSKNWFCDTVYGSFIPSGQKDFYAVILHELGHAHGLKHVIDVDAIMHYSVTSGPRKIDLDSDNSCDVGGNWEMNYSTASTNQMNCVGILNVSRISNPPCSPINSNSKIEQSPQSFSVFPNPTTNVINLAPKLVSQNPVNLIVLDITGKIVLIETHSKSDEIISIDFTNFQNGVYILKLQDTETQMIESFKIIKQ
jgi:hypothetical protein